MPNKRWNHVDDGRFNTAPLPTHIQACIRNDSKSWIRLNEEPDSDCLRVRPSRQVDKQASCEQSKPSQPASNEEDTRETTTTTTQLNNQPCNASGQPNHSVKSMYCELCLLLKYYLHNISFYKFKIRILYYNCVGARLSQSNRKYQPPSLYHWSTWLKPNTTLCEKHEYVPQKAIVSYGLIGQNGATEANSSWWTPVHVHTCEGQQRWEDWSKVRSETAEASANMCKWSCPIYDLNNHELQSIAQKIRPARNVDRVRSACCVTLCWVFVVRNQAKIS